MTGVNPLSALWQLSSYGGKKIWLSRLVWFVFHWAKQEMESFPPCDTNFIDKLKRIVSHLMTLMEATVIPSINILGVISLGQTQPGKVYGRLEIT